MAVLPAEIPTGLVTGQFYFVNEDNIDGDTDPDLTVVSGSVTFTCEARDQNGNLAPLRMPTKKAVVIPLKFDAIFDSQGRLTAPNDATPGLKIPATNSSLFNPTNFTWRVEFNLVDVSTGFTIVIPPFSMSVPVGVTTDLVDAMPVATSPGTITVQGPPSTVPGPAGAGVPAGGTALQVIRKNAANTTTEWYDPVATKLATIKPETDTPSTYPLGISFQGPGTGDGWSGGLVSVTTFRDHTGRGWQVQVEKVNSTFQVRTETDGDAWTSWKTLATNAVATGTVNGLMPAADKAALTAASASPTPNTLVKLDANGRTQVANPSVAADVANKTYVDTAVGTKANTSHTHLLGDITVTALGASQDLNTYTTTGLFHQSSNANATLVLNYPEVAAGLLQVYATGTFFYQQYWVYASGGADLYWRAQYNAGAWTAWQRAANDSPATGTVTGLMPAADKAKLDAASASSTPNTLVKLDGSGRAQVVNPAVAADIANKSYVDTGLALKLDTTANRAQQIVTAPAESAAPSTYPPGLSFFSVGASDAWAVSLATVYNMRNVAGRSYQMAVGKVDAQVWVRSETDTDVWIAWTKLATTTAVTASVNGLMVAADKAAMDARTSNSTVSTLVTRNSSGASTFAYVSLDNDPSSSVHSARKGYVDTQDALKANVSHTHAATDITSGVLAPAQLPAATGSAAGSMSAADKAKLDAASASPTANTLVKLDGSGRAQVVNPAVAADIANKSYVDAQDLLAALGGIAYNTSSTLTAALNTTETMVLEVTSVALVANRNYRITIGLDVQSTTAASIGVTANLRWGGTGGNPNGTLLRASTVWSPPVASAIGEWSEIVFKYTPTASTTTRFNVAVVRANGAADFKIGTRDLLIEDMGAATI